MMVSVMPEFARTIRNLDIIDKCQPVKFTDSGAVVVYEPPPGKANLVYEEAGASFGDTFHATLPERTMVRYELQTNEYSTILESDALVQRALIPMGMRHESGPVELPTEEGDIYRRIWVISIDSD